MHVARARPMNGCGTCTGRTGRSGRPSTSTIPCVESLAFVRHSRTRRHAQHHQCCEPKSKITRSVFPFFVDNVGRFRSGGVLIPKNRTRNRTLVGRFLGRYLSKTAQIIEISKDSVCMCWNQGCEPTRKMAESSFRFIVESVGRLRSGFPCRHVGVIGVGDRENISEKYR